MPITTDGSTGFTVAEALMASLVDCGIEQVLVNSGTDFAPIIEGIVRTRHRQAPLPRFIVVPHETVAVAMAEGYYQIKDKPAAVMVHVSVGTANTLCMLMNASRDNAPLLLMAGRTPLTETGHHGSRSGSIHWGQENFDQGAMVREHVKWDYELRAGQPVDTIVRRALDISMSEPRGPVYLTLPREVLGDQAAEADRPLNVSVLGNTSTVPEQRAIEAAAQLLAEAENPLIITGKHNGGAAFFDALSSLANRYAFPVTQLSDPSMVSVDEMNFGFQPGRFLKHADVIVVVECPVPWMPRSQQLNSDAKVIQIAPDPMYARFPFRGFQNDLSLAGSPARTLSLLEAALADLMRSKATAHERRKKRLETERAKLQSARLDAIEKSKAAPTITRTWLTHCISNAKSRDGIVCSELGVNPDVLEHTRPRAYVSAWLAGALGFGLGGGLGAKLAAPEREVVTVVGDGSYMFGCPTPAHFVGHAEKLPTLTIVSNNNGWFAVKSSTLGMYPDGKAASENTMPLTELKPSPAFEKTIEACGGYGERVENPAELPKALDRALKRVHDGQQALLNVTTAASRE